MCRLRTTAALTAVAIALAACCVARRTAPPAGSFVEDFEGFPIYHGDPGHPYVVLAPVTGGDPAAIGSGPMKRATVAEARRLGADAIVLRPAPGTADGPPGDAPPVRPDVGTRWRHAVAIRWH
jgi:hypothetical protein